MTTSASSSNSTQPTASQRSDNLLRMHMIELGPVQHAHQSGPPRMPGGVDEYA